MFDIAEERESVSYKVFKGHSSCFITLYNNGKAWVMIVDSVETDKDHRGKGSATTLINQIIEYAKETKVDAIELLVNEDNVAAKKLYEKSGFEPIKNKEHWRLILNKWD